MRYKDSGVDIKEEGKAVRAMLDEIRDKNLPGIFAKYAYKDGKAVGVSMDGVGSKLLCYLKDPEGIHKAAYDLGAMLFNDLAAEYIKPLLITDYLAVNQPDERLSMELGKGLRRLAEEVGCLYIAGGETATLIDQIKENTFDWAGAVIGIEDEEAHKGWMRKRKNLEPGIRMIGVCSSGLHSNGYTLARRLFEKMDMHETIPDSDKTLIQELITPSYIYSSLMVELRDVAEFFVPITGGGFTNLNRVLPDYLDARIEVKKRPPIFSLIQDMLEVPDEEMYKVFNMGIGLIIGTKRPEAVIHESEKYGAKEIGELVEGKGRVFVNEIRYDEYQ